MGRQAVRLPFVLAAVIFYTATIPSSLFAQNGPRKDWQSAEYRALYIEVPREFNVFTGTRLGSFRTPPFVINNISATNIREGLFVSAGYGYLPRPRYENEDELDKMAESRLEFFEGLVLPGIGSFCFTCPRTNVGRYTSIEGVDGPVREITARSQATGRYYRMYFVLALKPEAHRVKLFYIITGCPEDEIEDKNWVMSTILASFRLN